jgi:predicted nucleotidyltransferase
MDEAIDKVKEFVAKVKRKYRVEKAIFFGSRVRGESLKYSDVDIILVSDDFRGIPFPERASKVYDFWPGGLPLEVLCYTTEEFEKKKRMVGIVSDAVREGIEII